MAAALVYGLLFCLIIVTTILAVNVTAKDPVGTWGPWYSIPSLSDNLTEVKGRLCYDSSGNVMSPKYCDLKTDDPLNQVTVAKSNDMYQWGPYQVYMEDDDNIVYTRNCVEVGSNGKVVPVSYCPTNEDIIKTNAKSRTFGWGPYVDYVDTDDYTVQKRNCYDSFGRVASPEKCGTESTTNVIDKPHIYSWQNEWKTPIDNVDYSVNYKYCVDELGRTVSPDKCPPVGGVLDPILNSINFLTKPRTYSWQNDYTTKYDNADYSVGFRYCVDDLGRKVSPELCPPINGITDPIGHSLKVQNKPHTYAWRDAHYMVGLHEWNIRFDECVDELGRIVSPELCPRSGDSIYYLGDTMRIDQKPMVYKFGDWTTLKDTYDYSVRKRICYDQYGRPSESKECSSAGSDMEIIDKPHTYSWGAWADSLNNGSKPIFRVRNCFDENGNLASPAKCGGIGNGLNYEYKPENYITSTDPVRVLSVTFKKIQDGLSADSVGNIAEIEVYDFNNSRYTPTSNPAAGAIASSSTAADVPGNVLDGNLNSHWHTDLAFSTTKFRDHWIKISFFSGVFFGSAPVSRVVIRARPGLEYRLLGMALILQLIRPDGSTYDVTSPVIQGTPPKAVEFILYSYNTITMTNL